MLELAGIIIGIVAAASILLFGSRGFVDLLRGIAEKRNSTTKGESKTNEIQIEPVADPDVPGLKESTPVPINSLPPPLTITGTNTGFVGRRRELGTLKAALDNSLNSHGSVAMLAGEPGIGKTRTTQELADYARSSGVEVLWGRSYDEAGTPPFWPWIEVARSLVRGRDKDQLRSVLGPGAADVAEMVPEIKATLPELQPNSTLEPDQARFRLFDCLTTFITNVSHEKPRMVVLEDLHWADTPSLRMLEFLSGRIANAPILVVGAYRDGEVTPEHPLTETLANLSREPGFRLEVLHRFDTGETSDLIEATGGHPPTQELAQRIQEHTDGNPFFVNEIVKLLAERSDHGSIDDAAHEGLAVPEGVRAVTRQRLRRLSALCNQVLTIASVVGREFDFNLVFELSDDSTEGAFSEAMEEAVQAHLVEELQSQPGRYHFSHSLIQQALAEELSATRRVRLHGRIAETLEGLYGEELEAHASELAHHFAHARTVLGTDNTNSA